MGDVSLNSDAPPNKENSQQLNEWRLFLGYLQKSKKVAIGKFGIYEFYIRPPPDDANFSHAIVAYRVKKIHIANDTEKGDRSDKMNSIVTLKVEPSSTESANTCFNSGLSYHVRERDHKLREAVSGHNAHDLRDITSRTSERSNDENYVRAHPSYLKTLGQVHSAWIFGAVAELVDNSRDAKATTMEICIDMIYLHNAGKDTPMLSVIDDGRGMTHLEIFRMISLGHEHPDTDDPDHIGRFGIGFKTGAMRLGKDALVLTQTANSRSIAFLSQSFNEGKDNVEIPVVSYCRKGQFMEVDTSVLSETAAKYNMKVIKEFSPFNKYLIGEKVGLFQERGTGTQIYIWNLDEWGSNFCLQWDNGINGGSSFHQGDILIRSRRCRSRTGQMSRTVPLDFSLRSYLEVIFLDPRMKIYIQGSLVRSRPLARTLNKTVVESGNILGKPVQLTLGRCQLEREQANCGIFLYWHGRLIEAYKRVGGMIHNGDKSHGIIGVIDVTELMNHGDGRVWVHNSKQEFLDSEVYAQLLDWLGEKADEYLDRNFDKLQVRKGNSLYKPDHEWVQCDKCRKWRMLSSGFDCKTLPQEWFCYMKPLNGNCEMPEQKVERGVITVSAKRSGYDTKQSPTKQNDGLFGGSSRPSEGSSDDDSSWNLEK
ncbi:hypothetical protein RJ639_008528, partial [Escallonia herrerae]